MSTHTQSRRSTRCLLIIGLVVLVALGMRPLRAAATSDTSPIDIAAIEGHIEAQMRKHGLPGVALAITRGDQVVYTNAYGSAGPGRALTPQTPMYIGSSSKSFTALAIAQLAEQGKIDLDAPVRAYIPWFRVADEDASAKLTVRHFVHHASGLSESGFGVLLPDNATLEGAVRALKDARLTAPIGVTSQYFNLNYAVLALVIEVASGQSYADYVTEHIFAPLGMTHTYTSVEAALAGGLAQGYSRFFGFAVPRSQPHRAYELSDGYLISSAEDMARFAVAINNGGRLGDTRLLSAAWMQRLSTPRQQGGFRYAMGWFIDDISGIPRIHHGGANETFKTFMQLYPTRRLGLVVMINEGSLFDHYISAEQLFQGVERLALGLGRPDPAEGIAVPLIGWSVLALVVALTIFQGWQVWRLRSWRERAGGMSPLRYTLDIAANFIIPTTIMGVVVWQVAGFFDDRFNLLYQARMLFKVLPDIGILMLVGTVPDYAQGLIKLWWVSSGKVYRAPELVSAAVG
jgi:CubicO group peptidase (beta-lactamase class C family)